MMAVTPPPDPGEAIRERNRRIRELNKAGWSNTEIAVDVGLSDERVRQILATPAPGEIRAEEKRRLTAELRMLLVNTEDHRRRIRALRAAIDRLESEDEVERIDRLLGLA